MNPLLDGVRGFALIGGVSTLGLSLRERVCSRLLFYFLVFAGMWLMNRLVPDPSEIEADHWEALGVARPYIAVPIDELERILVRESR